MIQVMNDAGRFLEQFGTIWAIFCDSAPGYGLHSDQAAGGSPEEAPLCFHRRECACGSVFLCERHSQWNVRGQPRAAGAL